MNGAAADLASRSPDGTAFFQIASHCSGFRAAEGRPDVMVFVCASAHVAVNGSATREMMNALNICLLLEEARCMLNTGLHDLSCCDRWLVGGTRGKSSAALTINLYPPNWF